MDWQAGSATGTAGWPATGPGSGAQPSLDRTPVRGFPPVRAVRADPSGLWQDPWAVHEGDEGGYAADHPRTADGQYVADGHQYAPDDTQDVLDEPVPQAAVPPGGGGRRSARARRRLRSRPALLAMAGLVLIAGGFAGYKYVYEARLNAPLSPSLRLPTTVPTNPDFVKALGKWQHIGTRAEDPSPPTIDQLFPLRFELNGSSFVRTAASVTTTCSVGVLGSQLQAALASGNCTQVLRASYLSGTTMGTIGVVNLVSASAAEKAGEVTGPQEIIAPLSASKGVTSKLGTGTGVVQAEVKGHYLILMWAEFTDLKPPSTSAQRALLEQFVTNLVTGSANIDLSNRMVHGKK
jgi:hypothetical protein